MIENSIFLIPRETAPSSIHLSVSDIQRSVDFYSTIIGLQLHNHADGQISMGSRNHAFLQLSELSGAKKLPGHSGLYHFAILVPDRPTLAKFLRNLSIHNQKIQGASDHLVSEAIYLADPDGNGIEVYRDWPRKDWRRVNGQIEMAVLPLDYDSLMAESDSGKDKTFEIPDETVLGHVHLHVDDLSKADNFYRNILGFEKTAEIPGNAVFFAAGGYHHHLAANIWNGRGAPPQPMDAIGLRSFTLDIPDNQSMTLLQEQIQAAGLDFSLEQNKIVTSDPAGNKIILSLLENQH